MVTLNSKHLTHLYRTCIAHNFKDCDKDLFNIPASECSLLYNNAL